MSENIPAATDDEREALEALIQGEDERWDGSKSSEDFSTRVADAILAAGFRRLSPLTQEALEDAIDDALRDWAGEFSEIDAGFIAKAVLSRFSLPEPAEVEWEYQCQLSGNPWTDVDADHRCPGIRRHRIKAGPWLPVEEGTK